MKLFKTLFVALSLWVSISCEELIEVPDISTENVQLLAPSDGVAISQSTVQFNWNEVAEANHYHLQVATPNFENARQLVLDSLVFVDSTFTGTRVTKTLEDGEYQWRVKAMNNEFNTEFSTGSFMVSTPD